MATLIDGTRLAELKLAKLKRHIDQSGTRPGLAIVLAGDNSSSQLYVSLKERAAQRMGVNFINKTFPSPASTDSIIQTIKNLNSDTAIHGIVVQLPLPSGLDTDLIIRAIDPAKDVDGFHPENIKRYLYGDNSKIPLLISVIDQLIEETGESLEDTKAAIVAKESVFSKSMQHYFQTHGAKAERAELNSRQLVQADTIVTALGQPHVITGDMIKEGAVVIDVGISKQEGKTVGDIDAQTVDERAAWRTPVPGGVGPMTVASLLERTYNGTTNA